MGSKRQLRHGYVSLDLRLELVRVWWCWWQSPGAWQHARAGGTAVGAQQDASTGGTVLRARQHSGHSGAPAVLHLVVMKVKGTGCSLYHGEGAGVSRICVT